MNQLAKEKKSELVGAAVAARQQAYAPYSKFLVGASLLTKCGEIYPGCNVENASYGLCFCAERTAIVKAVSEGIRDFVAFAVATEGGGTPCGACRQFMAEFCDDDTLVIVHDVKDGTQSEFTLGDLLPEAFRLRDDE